MDNRGDTDVTFSGRKGEARGGGWLENPGNAATWWVDRAIGGQQDEVMFLGVVRSKAGL